jgi:transcriptional regulator with XRE-family HTH domain
VATTKQVPKRQTSEDRRRAAHELRDRWAKEIRQALAERGMSVHAAARQAGISPGALQAWLQQDVEPSPRAMEALARVVGRRHLHLISLLGWLPKELEEIPIQLEAANKLREALAEAQRWVEAASTSVTFGGGSLIANAMLEATSEWEVTLRHGTRGTEHQVCFLTNIGFSRSGQPGPHDPPPSPADTERDRAEIERLIAPVLRQTGAYWRLPERTATWTWPKRRDLVCSTPVLLASKPRGLRPNLSVPQSIVVAGVPFSGAPEVGALIASSLDWAFIDLPESARQRFGVASGSDNELVAQAEIARGLLEDPTGAGRCLVWSYRDLEPLVESLREPLLGRELPLVVFLRIPESLIEYGGRRLPRGADAAAIETAQNRIGRLLDQRGNDRSVVLDLPDLPLGPDKLHDVDVFFDAYVKLAFEAVQWLHKFHEGPRLEAAPGILAELWRDAHRRGEAPADD